MHTPHWPHFRRLHSRAVVASLMVIPLLMGIAGTSPASAASPPVVQIRITASEFAFAPNIVLLPLGQAVQLTVANNGLLNHDLKSSIVISNLTYIKADNDLDEQKDNAAKGVLDVDFDKGTTAQVTFTPTRPGVYEFHCDVTGHAAGGMTGTFIVLPADAVSQWLSLHDGDVIKGSANNVYVVQGGQKQWIPDIGTFANLGYVWNQVKWVSDSVLDAFTNTPARQQSPGNALVTSQQSPGNAVVTITLDEWRITPNVASVPAGKVSFVVVNQGKLDHEVVLLQTERAPTGLVVPTPIR